jgi:uncharacterized protein YcgL (UPF0745 family)
MLLILNIELERNVAGLDYAKIKSAIEKKGYVVHYRPSDLYPTQIIIEGAETWPEIEKKLTEVFA